MVIRVSTVCLVLILGAMPWAPALSEAPTHGVLVGEALRWNTISNCPLSSGYPVLVLVEDWDNDGASEILLPAGAIFSRQLEVLKDVSFVMELDGTVKPVPLNGTCLSGTATTWDYDRDGFPEIVVDSGGWANLTLTKRTRAAKTFTDQSLLDEFNRSEEELKALTEDLQALDPQEGDFYDRSMELLSRLSAHNIFYQGLEWEAHADFGSYDEAMAGLHEGLGQGQTVVLNLAGKLQAKLKGTLTGPGSMPVGNYYGATGDDLVLVEFRRPDPETQVTPPAKLRCYSKGGKLVKQHTCLNRYQPGAVGDIDNDGKLELLETSFQPNRDGGFRPQILTGIFGSKGKPLKTPKFDESEFVEASLCFDLNHDGCAETVVSGNLAWDSRNKQTITLDIPPGFGEGASFASNNANVAYFSLSENSPLLTWFSTTHSLESTGIAAYDASGTLQYFEELGEPVLWITTATDEAGIPFLVVQTESRILVWQQGGTRGKLLVS